MSGSLMNCKGDTPIRPASGMRENWKIRLSPPEAGSTRIGHFSIPDDRELSGKKVSDIYYYTGSNSLLKLVS